MLYVGSLVLTFLVVVVQGLYKVCYAWLAVQLKQGIYVIHCELPDYTVLCLRYRPWFSCMALVYTFCKGFVYGIFIHNHIVCPPQLCRVCSCIKSYYGLILSLCLCYILGIFCHYYFFTPKRSKLVTCSLIVFSHIENSPKLFQVLDNLLRKSLLLQFSSPGPQVDGRCSLLASQQSC